MKYLTLVALAVCTFATGCMSYTERTVVQKPVPAAQLSGRVITAGKIRL